KAFVVVVGEMLGGHEFGMRVLHIRVTRQGATPPYWSKSGHVNVPPHHGARRSGPRAWRPSPRNPDRTNDRSPRRRRPHLAAGRGAVVPPTAGRRRTGAPDTGGGRAGAGTGVPQLLR